MAIAMHLMHCSLSSSSETTLSRIRMSSVSSTSSFQSGTKLSAKPATDAFSAKPANDRLSAEKNDVDSTPTADETNLETTVDKETSIDVKPTQGFHIFDSLKTRIWRHFKSAHLAFELFHVVFADQLQNRKMHPKQKLTKRERKFLHLQKATATCTSRRSHTKLLVDLSVIFDHPSEIEHRSELFDDIFGGPPPNTPTTETTNDEPTGKPPKAKFQGKRGIDEPTDKPPTAKSPETPVISNNQTPEITGPCSWERFLPDHLLDFVEREEEMIDHASHLFLKHCNFEQLKAHPSGQRKNTKGKGKLSSTMSRSPTNDEKRLDLIRLHVFNDWMQLQRNQRIKEKVFNKVHGMHSTPAKRSGTSRRRRVSNRIISSVRRNIIEDLPSMSDEEASLPSLSDLPSPTFFPSKESPEGRESSGNLTFGEPCGNLCSDERSGNLSSEERSGNLSDVDTPTAKTSKKRLEGSTAVDTPTFETPKKRLKRCGPSANLSSDESSGNHSSDEPGGNLSSDEPSGNPSSDEPSGNLTAVDALTTKTPKKRLEGCGPTENLTCDEPSGNLSSDEPSGNLTTDKLFGKSHCPEHLPDGFTSSFFIQTPTFNIRLDSHTFEIHSAKLLANCFHWRSSGGQTSSSCGVELRIKAHVSEFLNDNLSVLRMNSNIVLQQTSSLSADWTATLMMCKTHGNPDDRRRDCESVSLEFGVKPELSSEVCGENHFEPSQCFAGKWPVKAKRSLANIIDFIWIAGKEIQQGLKKPPLGGMFRRKRRFGLKVARMFGCKKEPEFESMTVVHTIMERKTHVNSHCSPHLDTLNDTMCPHCETLAMNVMLSEDKDSGECDLHFLQVLCDFRRVGKNVLEHKDHIPLMTKNVKSHLTKVSKECSEVFDCSVQPSKLSQCLDPTDLTDFHLSSEMKFEDHLLCEDSALTTQALKTMIGPSRELSLSGYLSPLLRLSKEGMKFDQVMELCLLASMVGTPLLHNWALHNTDFQSKTNDHTMPSAIESMLKEFKSFHKGKFPRHSNSNNTTIKHFASGKESSTKLKAVIRELFWWMECIDSKENCGFICPQELVDTMDNILIRMKEAGDCPSLDFGDFRFGLFTTIVCALGMVKPAVAAAAAARRQWVRQACGCLESTIRHHHQCCSSLRRDFAHRCVSDC